MLVLLPPSHLPWHESLMLTLLPLPHLRHQSVYHCTDLAAPPLQALTMLPLADADLAAPCAGINLEAMRPGQALKVPITLALDQYSGSSSNSSIPESLRHNAVAALAHATSMGGTPRDGLVAVKVQYPDAQQTMARDLVNLRAAAAFLSKTEIKFDLVSAVTELQKQIHLEFDFKR